jgi:hypothetical protein
MAYLQADSLFVCIFHNRIMAGRAPMTFVEAIHEK